MDNDIRDIPHLEEDVSFEDDKKLIINEEYLLDESDNEIDDLSQIDYEW